MRRAEVIRDYRAQYANPIKFASGTVVAIGERDTEWPDFIRVTTAEGNSGWAPADWLKPLDEERAQALRDYSAKEADLDVGDEVGFCWEYGGWCWVVRDESAFGWVPASHLDIGPDYPEPERSLEETAAAWLRYWQLGARDNPSASDEFYWATLKVDDLLQKDPERAWTLIQAMYRLPDAKPQFGMIAASVVEDFLGFHGADYIERVESLARQDPEFASLLGGVWQFTMPDEIWARVQSVKELGGPERQSP